MWHGAYLSKQEVDLRDSGGVFVESCKFHTRNPIAAAIQLRKLKTTQSLGECTTSLQLAAMVGITRIMKKFEKLDVDKNKSSQQLKEFTLFTNVYQLSGTLTQHHNSRNWHYLQCLSVSSNNNTARRKTHQWNVDSIMRYLSPFTLSDE